MECKDFSVCVDGRQSPLTHLCPPTANVERNGGHKWVKQATPLLDTQTKYCIKEDLFKRPIAVLVNDTACVFTRIDQYPRILPW